MFNVKNLIYCILIAIFSCGSIFGFISVNLYFYNYIDNFIDMTLSSQISFIIFYIINIFYYTCLSGLYALIMFPITFVDLIYNLLK